MVICVEETSESNIEVKEKAAIVPVARQWPEESGSVLLQRKHNLSVTFLRDFQGVVLKLCQAPEITRNFVTFLPSSSQLKLSLEVPQSTSLPRKDNSVKMLGWNNNTEPANRSQIIKTLREVVKRVVVEFRMSTSPLNLNDRSNFNDVVEAVPVSFRPPTSTNMDMVLSPKKRVTTLLVGEIQVSFELPRNCPFGPEDVDKLVEERDEAMSQNTNGENIYNVRRYTFLERLKGWKMERRQRVNGRFDMYYHHLRSRRVFRSIAEVVNFFLYEEYPDKPQNKSANKSKLGEDDLSSKKTEKREERATPLKRKIDEIKKPREKWQPIYDLNVEIQKAYHQNPIYENVDQKAHDHHIPFFDLNDDQKEDDNKIPIYDLDDDDDQKGYDQNSPIIYDVEDNYEEAYNPKERVEKFLAEAYDNLINLPHAQKCPSFSFDINEEISEVEEDGNFHSNNQSVEELLAEAYNNLMNYPFNEAKLQKGKERRTKSIEKPRRKKVKTFTPTSFPSFPNTPININSIPSEKNNDEKERASEKNNKEKEKEKEKEKITNTDTVESMEVQKAAPIANVKHKRFNIKEVNGNVIFTDVDCEPSYVATTSTGGVGGSSSAMEVAKSVAYMHIDECDLINHIPESSDMFDLAMFLVNNRGNGGF